MHSDETHWFAFALVTCRELGVDKTHFHPVQTKLSCASSEHELQGSNIQQEIFTKKADNPEL